MAGFHRDSLHDLSREPDVEPERGWPPFAARDEAEEVDVAARSMLSQDHPGLTVIAVDDRSEDATGRILDDLAREDPRLRVAHVTGLPPGWLGKTHALQAAADLTDARFILFTDADVRFAPGALRRAVAMAERPRLDHIRGNPQTFSSGRAEHAFIAIFCLMFAILRPVRRINDRRSRAAMSAGAFNLVRSSAFRAVGGFRRIALSVDDDLWLRQALKRAGYRHLLVLVNEDVSVRWHFGRRRRSAAWRRTSSPCSTTGRAPACRWRCFSS